MYVCMCMYIFNIYIYAYVFVSVWHVCKCIHIYTVTHVWCTAMYLIVNLFVHLSIWQHSVSFSPGSGAGRREAQGMWEGWHSHSRRTRPAWTCKGLTCSGFLLYSWQLKRVHKRPILLYGNLGQGPDKGIALRTDISIHPDPCHKQRSPSEKNCN